MLGYFVSSLAIGIMALIANGEPADRDSSDRSDNGATECSDNSDPRGVHG
jgi:hypothetical protein